MKQRDIENLNRKKRAKNNSEIEQEDLPKKRKKSNQPIKGKKKPKKKFKRKVFMLILLALIILLSILFFKLYTFKTLAQEMFNNSPSTVFGSNKNVIAEVGSERNRENIDYEEIPKNLINAYISIEDQRYYTHHGVDVKRTGAAILSYVTHKGSSFGGSTITQQLAKNLTGDDSSHVYRKVKEWFYAWTLNACFSKEAVLEAYFNIIYTGPNIYGVQTASHYYFSKDVQNLSLAECAYLAGLNNSPNSYNPFTDTDRTEKIAKRTTTVLNKMLELELISQSEYDLALLEVNNGLAFKKGLFDKNNKIYSYHTDALINEVISDITDTKHISKDFAANFIYLSGLSIYSTENIEIQKIVEQETQNNKYIIKSANGEDSSQAALVVIDHLNGKVIACTRRFGQKDFF